MTQIIKQNKLSKGCAILYYIIAVIFETLGADHYALRLVKKALLKDPKKRALHLYASRLYLKRGQVDGSVMHWKRAIGPVHMGSFLYWLGQSKNKLLPGGKLNECSSEVISTRQNTTTKGNCQYLNQPTLLNDQGLFLLDQGLVHEALNLFLKDLKTGKENPILFINIGLTYSKSNKHKEALSYYEKAQSMGLNNLELLNNKGYSLFHLNRFEEALACYELIRNLDPDDHVVLNNLATCYVKTNQINRALSCFLSAISNNSEDATLANNLAVCLEIIGEKRAAIGYYDQALALEKVTDVRNKILINKVNCLMQLKNYDEALRICENIPCGDKEFEIWGLKAELFNELGRTKEALESYRKALGLTG